MSAGGVPVSIYWNVNALTTVSLAREGAVVRQFDALMSDDGGDPRSDEEGLPFGEVSKALHAAMFVYLERVTRQRIGRE